MLSLAALTERRGLRLTPVLHFLPGSFPVLRRLAYGRNGGATAMMTDTAWLAALRRYESREDGHAPPHEFE